MQGFTVSVETKHEIRTVRHTGLRHITTKMQYKGKSAQRFMSNATTNGVEATQTDLLHIKPPPLNPKVDRDIDIHTCNDIKDCTCGWNEQFLFAATLLFVPSLCL